MLKTHHVEDSTIIEIGVDEAGRGPLFGPVYTGAVVLPRESETFDYSLLKDSKKFTSFKKLTMVTEYIKEHADFWSVNCVDEKEIDSINIRQATLKSMHASIDSIIKQMPPQKNSDDVLLIIDGNDFKPYYRVTHDSADLFSHICVKGGDNVYGSVAAASILAKHARDTFIGDLCEKHPLLKKYYSIDKNKGYGAKVHLEGIRTYGVSQWHRLTFGICRTARRIIL